MVPDPRPALHHYLVRPFRRSRALALLVGLAVGAAALFAAEYYAHVSLYEYVFIPLAVGGCTYYFAHYDLSDWSQGSLTRTILRSWAMMIVPMMLLPDDVPLADGFVSYMAVYGIILFAVVTAVVDVVDADGDDEADDGRDVDGANTPSAAGAVDAD